HSTNLSPKNLRCPKNDDLGGGLLLAKQLGIARYHHATPLILEYSANSALRANCCPSACAYWGNGGEIMPALQLSRPGWAIVLVTTMMCSLGAVGAFLRFHDVNYATAVSDMSYRLCQDSKAVDKNRSCRAEASQTYDVLDPGARTVLAPAILGVALLWTIFGLLAAALVSVIRFFHVAARAIEGIAVDYRRSL